MSETNNTFDISEIGEFGLIDRIRQSFAVPQGCMGIGDDCSIIPQKDGLDTLVSTDLLIEEVHFLLDDISPYQLGWKSAAVNISDIAAMGGCPAATFLSIALPSHISGEWMSEFVRGFKDICGQYGVSLLGGDTTSSKSALCINVCILGNCEHGKARCRKDAKVGDKICVSGHLGDSGAGLKVILDGVTRDELSQKLIERHYLPYPRVQEGISLASTDGIGAMMDISDGIASDLRHILDESGVGAKVMTKDIPMSGEMIDLCKREGWDPLALACCSGEDYELLFTMRPDCKPEIPYHVIGEITSGHEMEWIGSQKDFKGFNHF